MKSLNVKKNFLFFLFIFLTLNSINLYAEKPVLEIIFSELTGTDKKKIDHAFSYIKIIKPKKIIHKLVDAILDESDNEIQKRLAGALKLYNTGDILLSWLKILEKTDSFKFKIDIINYLSKLNDRRTVIPFAKQLNSPSHRVRKTAIIALNKNHDDRVIPYILNLMDNPNPAYKLYGISAMNYLYDKRFYSILIGQLKHRNKSIRIYTLKCILLNNLNESLYLIREMVNSDANIEVRIKAIHTVVGLRDRKSLYVLLRALKYYDKNVRYAAIDAFNKLNLSASANPLSNRLLTEKNGKNKNHIIETLIKFRNGGNLDGLQRILLYDENPGLRIKAAYALGIINNEKAVYILNRGLKNKNYRQRAEICNSLGLYRPGLVLPTLFNVLKYDSERYVKSAALYAIKKYDIKNTVHLLFDIYSVEKDPVLKEILRVIIKEFMRKYI